jgi:hypothetical protein
MAIVKKSKFSFHPLLGVMMAYYGFQLIGLLWTIDIDEGIKFIDKGLSFIIIPLGFSLLSITSQQRDKVLLFFIRFLIVFLLMGMLGYLFQVYFHDLSFWVGFGTEKVYFPLSPELDTVYEQILVGSGYGHPAYTSLIFVTMIPVSFYLWSKEKSNKLKLSNTELFAFLFLSAIVIFIIKSRIGFLMYPFGLFLSVLFLLRKSKVLPYILFSLIFLAVIAAIMIYKNRTDFSFITLFFAPQIETHRNHRDEDERSVSRMSVSRPNKYLLIHGIKFGRQGEVYLFGSESYPKTQVVEIHLKKIA